MSTNNKIYISILTYNSSEIIKNCLINLEKQTNKNFEAFVFDNNSSDNIEEICKEFKFVKFIKFASNTGYSGGNNQAFEYFKQNFKDFRYFLVLNPDTVIDSNLIEELELFILKHPNFSLANPALVKNNKENPQIQEFIGPSFTHIYLPKKGNKVYEKVKWAGGYCLLVNVSKIENHLFNDYFLYFEDIQLSVRLALKSDEVYCIYSTHVFHPEKENIQDYRIYYCELNRYKFLADTFNKKFLILYSPIFILIRVILFLVNSLTLKKNYPYLLHLKANLKGLVYFYTKIFSRGENVKFTETLKFLFLN